ncbi:MULTISPECIES: endonuclease/exonuclease/phosphatase family protein [unclassified Streptomyces]|uniref:GDSL-type esterase/lipase family protein n=1 Tax=unclassified Streptomyces TaxID=2593676 RepID=UPI001F0FD22A|nr:MULTISPECIES: endonuclease/exonuclease/phosphatase family protein [unclassified Streptomyces]
MVATSIVLLQKSAATAAVPAQTRAVTFNAAGGSRWGHIRDDLLREADVVALQEVQTPPSDFPLGQSFYKNLQDTSTTRSGLPSLKYQVYRGPWGKSSREAGELFYLQILDKQDWGATTNVPDDEDLDTQRNSQKSMAIWVRNTTSNGIPPEFRVITPQDGVENKWIRSRPAIGVKVEGIWYFNVHAASIRSGVTSNPHSQALVEAVRTEMAGQPWRILGDFNNLASSPLGAGVHTYYATTNGTPGGIPATTQLSGYALDYMVSSEEITGLAVSISSLNGGSDHWPVKIAPTAVRNCTWFWGSRTIYETPSFQAQAQPQTQTQTQTQALVGDDACKPDAIVSMGDSYISGEAGRWAGNANSYAEGSSWGTDRAIAHCNTDESVCEHRTEIVYGDTSYEEKKENACHRSVAAEIKLAKPARFPDATPKNIACSGATTADILSQSFKGERPQIEQLRDIAGDYEVKLVVVSIGGNDLRFSEILTDCAKAYLYPALNNHGCRASQEEAFSGQLASTKENVVRTLEAVRTTLRTAGQADGTYQIVLQGYPNPLPLASQYRYPEDSSNPFEKYGRYSKGGCPFLDADSEWARLSVVPRITGMLGEAAEQAGVSFLDLQHAFAGHELCAQTAQQADATNSLNRPLDAAQAEWVRWVPYLTEETKDIGWTAQGHKQEAIHPNYYGQQAMAACLNKIVAALGPAPVTSRCVGRSGASPDDLNDTGQPLAKGNRRPPVEGLPDWSRAGYHGGEPLPSDASTRFSGNSYCRISKFVMESSFHVRGDDEADDTAGIQQAIDSIRTKCSPYASRSRLSLIELPSGTLRVSKQLSVDASYLVLRGQGDGPRGTHIVFSPDEATRYDTLYKGERWDQQAMRHECAGRIGSIIGTGGWIWPGRGLFRVQTREVSAKHQRMCGNISDLPENRRDLFEGSVNQHWESGVAVAGTAADTAYAAHQGDRTIQLNPSAVMSAFTPGGYLWVGAANSLKFYQEQQIDTTANAGYLDDLHMRQQVFRISSVDADQRTVTIDKPLEFDLPVDSLSDGSAPIDGQTRYPSKVTPLKMITDVGFEDFSFTQKLDGMPKLGGGTYKADRECATAETVCPTHNYGNIAPEYAMHGIVFKWAADSWVRGVRGEMVGSHPVVTEVAKNIQIQDNYFDGSWNKGKGGNGYFRGSRVWDSLYAFNTTRNLRHFTFQWSASNNVVIGNDFDSDLNLHGGWERRNLFENNAVRVPAAHSSGSCTINCGGEGGGGDAGTWWPIYWSAGNKAVKWSGSSGPQNVFFRNTLAKQEKEFGSYTNYQPYSNPQTVFQFGSDQSGPPGAFKHLASGGMPILDWAGMEKETYTGGNGVDGSRHDASESLFLRSFPEELRPQ